MIAEPEHNPALFLSGLCTTPVPLAKVAERGTPSSDVYLLSALHLMYIMDGLVIWDAALLGKAWTYRCMTTPAVTFCPALATQDPCQLCCLSSTAIDFLALGLFRLAA